MEEKPSSAFETLDPSPPPQTLAPPDPSSAQTLAPPDPLRESPPLSDHPVRSPAPAIGAGGSAGGRGKRKSRSDVAADDRPEPSLRIPEAPGIEADPESRPLRARLVEIDGILQSGQSPDADRPEGARSPSSENPAFDDTGIRSPPASAPSAAHRRPLPPKLQKKIHIPMNGHLREGIAPSKNGDLAKAGDPHVPAEAETQESPAATAEKVLSPCSDAASEHPGRRPGEPTKLNEPPYEASCEECGHGGHSAADCATKGPSGAKKTDEGHGNFSPGPGFSTTESLTKPSAGDGDLVDGREFSNTSLYISSLPPTFNSKRLVDLFCPFGDIVKVNAVKDRATGLCKGFGFVRFASADQADQAATVLNGSHIEGRAIGVSAVVKKPRPQPQPQPRRPRPRRPRRPAAGPPAAPAVPLRPASNPFAHPLQQYTAHGPLSNLPPRGPPIPLPYAARPPPPPFVSSSFALLQGRLVPSYTAALRPPIASIAPPYLQPPISNPPAIAYPTNPFDYPAYYRPTVNPSSIIASSNPPAIAYPTNPFGYPAYYRPTVNPSSIIASAPWASNLLLPPRSSSLATQWPNDSGAGAEYENSQQRR